MGNVLPAQTSILGKPECDRRSPGAIGELCFERQSRVGDNWWGHPTAMSHTGHSPPKSPKDGAPTWVFWVGICSTRARLLWSKFSSRASRAPCTPLSTRLLPYSRSPMDWIQWMTWSFVHTSTSARQQGHSSGPPHATLVALRRFWDVLRPFPFAPG